MRLIYTDVTSAGKCDCSDARLTEKCDFTVAGSMDECYCSDAHLIEKRDSGGCSLDGEV